MKTLKAFMTGTGIGLLGMYIFDPEAGRRRRALARDQMIRLRNKTRDAAEVTARDLRNRSLGLLAEGRSYFVERNVNDEILAERVRAKLGFLVRNPSAIDVQVTDGHVTVRGLVLADEAQQLVAGIRSVRGVRDVENQLEVHDEPDNIPALQGDKPKPTGEPIDLLQQRWSPSTRFLVGMGALYILLSARHHINLGALAVLGTLAYSLSNADGVDVEPTDRTREETTAGWN